MGKHVKQEVSDGVLLGASTLVDNVKPEHSLYLKLPEPYRRQNSRMEQTACQSGDGQSLDSG